MPQLHLYKYNVNQGAGNGFGLYFNVANNDLKNSFSFYNIQYTIGTLNHASKIYPDFATAVAQNTADAFTNFISQVDAYTGLTYTQGNVYDVTEDIIQMLQGYAQPLNSKLTEYAGVTLANNDLLTRNSSGVLVGVPASSLGGYVATTSVLSASLTTGTGATGTQISATKSSSVKATVSCSTTTTIGGTSTSVVVAEICSTNSATAGDWIEVGRASVGHALTLGIALQDVNPQAQQICFDLPAGWYYKLRNSGTGTHSEAFVSGQKTIYG